MFFLFLGMAFSGIKARLVLLAHRGGFFLHHEAQKAPATVLLELIGFLAGIGAFLVSFMMFSWWIPLVALAVGYWVVAPIVVNVGTFAFAWSMKELMTIGTITCSVIILAKFFEFL